MLFKASSRSAVHLSSPYAPTSKVDPTPWFIFTKSEFNQQTHVVDNPCNRVDELAALLLGYHYI
jgi:hypothetical protein